MATTLIQKVFLISDLDFLCHNLRPFLLSCHYVPEKAVCARKYHASMSPFRKLKSQRVLNTSVKAVKCSLVVKSLLLHCIKQKCQSVMIFWYTKPV